MALHSPARFLLAILLILTATPPVVAQTYMLAKSVAASGGTDATGSTYHLRGTVGQGVAGRIGGSGQALAQGFWTAAAPVVIGPTYVVNSTADPGDGTCDAAECTLREAITASNGTALNDVIHFNIPGAGVHTITPVTPLPPITVPVVIDGYTQPGASPNTLTVGNDAVLLVELNGNGAAFVGLTLTADSVTIRGLVINRFNGNGQGYGLVLQTGGGHTITGNWIGIDATGAEDLANSRGGIYMENSAGTRLAGRLRPTAT
jgi:CSLREA domain-containing protein